MHTLVGRAQHYDWGDTEALPRFLGVEPDGRPWAEWWWGTHPGAPSDVVMHGEQQSLASVAGHLPYLVKLLAAARPLSLQVHPSADQAKQGFERDEAKGLGVGDPRRSYRDPFPKPELLCALTPFEALCGIAPMESSIHLLTAIGPAADAMRSRLVDNGPSGVLAWLLRERPDVSDLLAEAALLDDPRSRCAAQLGESYPDDPSAALALVLHHVVLAPGEALYLDAGNLHAYLGGVGVEVMAASDNVVRVGLTTKHVDVDEALMLVDPNPIMEPKVRATFDGEAWAYPSPGAPFVVRRYSLDGSLVATADHAEIWWCADGDAGALHAGAAATLLAGETVELEGVADIFRVSAPGPD